MMLNGREVGILKGSIFDQQRYEIDNCALPNATSISGPVIDLALAKHDGGDFDSGGSVYVYGKTAKA